MEQPFLGALHREGDGGAGGDGVQAELVTQTGGAEDSLAVADAAQRAQREQALVLQADFPGGASVDVLTADGTGGAGTAGDAVGGVQLLTGQRRGVLEGALL